MPNSAKQWCVNLTSEFFGTIFLTWMIGLLGVTIHGTLFESYISYGTPSHLIIGAWVGCADVFVCLLVFSRWSCDLNPAVTLYRMIDRQNTLKYGFAKLGTQFIAGFAAAGFIIGTQIIAHSYTGESADEISSKANGWSAFLASSKIAMADGGSPLRHLFAFLGEFAGVFVLIWAVFNKQIKSHFAKDVIIALTITFGVAALLDCKTVGWNPARSMATTFAYDLSKGGTDATQLYWAYFTAPLLSSYTFWLLQRPQVFDFFEKGWKKILSYGSLGPLKKPDDRKK